MRVKSWITRSSCLALVVAACVLGAAPVASAQPTSVQHAAAPSQTAEPNRGLLGRHWFKGLLCATFLLICALAGRNDRLKGDQPAPNQPPPAG